MIVKIKSNKSIMETFFLIFGITVLLLLICLVFFGVKIILKKNGEFKRSCSSVDPLTGEKTFCSCSNKSVYNDCKKGDKYNILDINKELMKEIK